MIVAINPKGLTISTMTIRYRLEEGEKFYVIDNGYNKIEISQEDYMKLKAPIRRRIIFNDVQWITGGAKVYYR